MKAAELRIGNIVNEETKEYIGDGKDEIYIREVTVTGYDIMMLESDGYLPEGREFKPISLTEEWLLKFGFNYENNDYFVMINKNILAISLIQSREGLLISCNLEGIDIDLKYVHQLQKLYFALNGEELCLK